MARRTDFNGSSQAIAATTVQTITWSNSQIPSDRIVAYHLTFQAAGNTLASIDRLRISANGSPIINVSTAQLRAYLQAFSVGAALKYPTTGQALTIPLCMLDAPQPELQDVCQFPMRSAIQVQLQLNATTAAGFVTLGWTETDILPQLFPRLLGSVMGIPASVSNARFAFQENGALRGLWLPQTGISRTRIVLGNEQWTHLPGDSFSGLAAQGNMLLEAESLYGNGIASAGTPLTTSAFHRLSGRVAAPVNGSYVEIDTAATWAGVANEACTYAVAPNGTGA